MGTMTWLVPVRTFQLVFVWAFLGHWLVQGQIGLPGDFCENDTSCTASHTYCDVGGICSCKIGYNLRNGQCSQVFGRTCLDNMDCNDGRTVCSNSKCTCKSYEWREENGVCVSYYGLSCNDWSDCGHSYHFLCENNVCICDLGYKYADGNCQKVINSECRKNATEDCPLEHSVCKTDFYWYQENGECRCEFGYAESNNLCVKGSSCAEVGCGSPMHYSYKFIDPLAKSDINFNSETYWWYWEVEYYHQWLYYYHLHLSCDINNICNCDHGFRPDVNGTSCEPVIGVNCSSSDDCGGYHGYTCDVGRCTCAANYIEYSETWGEFVDSSIYYWDYNYRTVTLCKPMLGQLCSNVECNVDNAYCDTNFTCSCKDGFTENNDGACIQVLDMQCVREKFCQIVEGGTCGTGNTCTCKDGYLRNGSICTPVLGSNCTSNIDCELQDTTCEQGLCACEPTLVEEGGRCMSTACSGVRDLPDIDRRSVNYRPVVEEILIDDTKLSETWYSIGRHSVLSSLEPPVAGSCGTFYPIYLREPLTQSHQDAIRDGEITITGHVAGTDIYGIEETVDIRLRKCGADTQINFKPPSSHFSGLCLDYEEIIGTQKSAVFSALVLTDLLFTDEITESGDIKHSPYLVFSCIPSEFVLLSSERKYPYDNFVTEDDIHFYYVHWFIDDVHYTSFGPLKRSDFIHGSSIFETEIMDVGYHIGSKIRCSFQVSETPNGRDTLVVHSKDLHTGFQQTHIAINEGEDSYFLQLRSNTPLGCETVGEYNDDEVCQMFWPVIGENKEICNGSNIGENQHTLCRIFIRGYSKQKYQDAWGSWDTLWDYHVNSNYDSNYTYIGDTRYSFSNSTTEHHGVNVSITDAGESTDTLKIKFGTTEGTTGHSIWNGYKMPDVNFDVVSDSFEKETCKITMLNVPILTKEEDWEVTFSNAYVEIDQIGEFIMYHSNEKPVQVQVQTEACDWTKSGVCICAVNYRDGANTFIYSYCNGLTRIGQTNGEPSSQDIDRILLINGIELTIESWNGRISNVSLNTNHTRVRYEDGEGLCAFTNGLYKHGDGSETTNSEGYIQSWRISTEESLLNPQNHVAVSWTEEFVQCGCPDKSEVLNQIERTYHYNSSYTSGSYIREYYTSVYNYYQGFIRCLAANVCEVKNNGTMAWNSTLQSEYSISTVTARMDIRYIGNWPFLHLSCDFDGQDGQYYSIKWMIDNEEVYQSAVMSYSDTVNYFVTNQDLQTTQFLLEARLSCAVSIQSSTGELVGTKHSETIVAVEIVETELLLPRGGDIAVQIRLNVPLVCARGESCSFDFKLFDPTDSNNCSDSSLVVKGRDTCGKRIVGRNVESDLMNSAQTFNITLTTKNNDMYVLKDTFKVKMKLAARGPTSGYLLHTFSQEITVFVRDDETYWQRTYCYANNDPRMRTFDGQYYSHLHVGLFTMMRHTRLPVEIQLETSFCGGWRAVCSCGITVRAGRDVFTVNHCHGDHITNYLLLADGTLKVRKRNAHRYQIYLPHGTKIDVRVSRWNSYMVNVYIYPSPADMNSIEGLCGNFDGSWSNDLIHSDGTVTSSSRYYWWWYTPDPDYFITSWDVSETNSVDLTDVDAIREALDSWFADDLFCVCPGDARDGDIKCSANEEDTCSTPVVKPGALVSISARNRNKRSTACLNNEYRTRLEVMREKRSALKKEAKKFVKRSLDADNITEAIEYCNMTLSSSCNIMSVTNDGVNVTFEELVQDCGKDRVLDPEKDWTSLTCEAMEANVENEVRRDVELQESKPEVFEEVTKVCVGNCSNGNGICVNGHCVCNNKYGEDDCSVGKSEFVIVNTGNGLCDRKEYECACMHVTTSGSLPSSSFSATYFKATENGTWVQVDTIVGQPEYINTNELNICPEAFRRKKRSTDETNYIADQYVISVSNDGSTFGNGTAVYVLDSTCLQINQSTDPATVELLTGYCIISGVCYMWNTSSPDDSCFFCNETGSPFEWSRNSDKVGCASIDSDSADEDDDSFLEEYRLVLIFGAIVAVGVVIIVVFVAFVIKKKPLSRSVAPETMGDLYQMPKNEKFRLRRDSWM